MSTHTLRIQHIRQEIETEESLIAERTAMNRLEIARFMTSSKKTGDALVIKTIHSRQDAVERSKKLIIRLKKELKILEESDRNANLDL